MKIMVSSPITSRQIDGETVTGCIFLGSKITADGDCCHEIKRCLLLGRKVMTNLSSVAQSCPTFVTTWISALQASLSITNSQSLLTFMPSRVGDAIQPSHPLLSPSSPAFNLSQHQSLFKWVSSSHQVAKVLDFQLQHQSLEYSGMNIQDSFPLGWTGDHSLQSKGLSIVFYNTTVQKHQFFSTQLSLWSNSHIHTWLLEKPYLWLDKHLLA